MARLNDLGCDTWQGSCHTSLSFLGCYGPSVFFPSSCVEVLVPTVMAVGPLGYLGMGKIRRRGSCEGVSALAGRERSQPLCDLHLSPPPLSCCRLFPFFLFPFLLPSLYPSLPPCLLPGGLSYFRPCLCLGRKWQEGCVIKSGSKLLAGTKSADT